MKPKIRYLAMALETGHMLDIAGYRREILLTWAPGMVGVMAVFDTKEAAKEYTRGKCKEVKLIAKEET